MFSSVLGIILIAIGLLFIMIPHIMEKKFPDPQSPDAVTGWLVVILICGITTVISVAGVSQFLINRERNNVSNVPGTRETTMSENANAIQEESIPVIETIKTSDTIRWFNAASALQINSNDGDYQFYGGFEPNNDNRLVAKYSLLMNYDITDKTTAEIALNQLRSKGGRADFATEMNLFAEAGIEEIAKEQRAAFLMETFAFEQEKAEDFANLYDRYSANGENTVSGWDYSRALYILANLYLAGYCTPEEALDASLNIAETIQANFDSWDDYMESYFIGYVYYYWTKGYTIGGMADDYEALRNIKDGPYSIDFKLELEKSW